MGKGREGGRETHQSIDGWEFINRLVNSFAKEPPGKDACDEFNDNFVGGETKNVEPVLFNFFLVFQFNVVLNIDGGKKRRPTLGKR